MSGQDIGNWKNRLNTLGAYVSSHLRWRKKRTIEVTAIESVSDLVVHKQCETGESDHIEPEDLYVLHLSDLHIGEGILSHAHYCLIRDMKDQLSGAKRIVVAITGDIVQQCDYSSENTEKIIEFFTKLKASIPTGCQLLSVEIVPGNHEIKLPLASNRFNEDKYCPLTNEYEQLKKNILSVFEQKNYDVNNCVTPIEYQHKSICFVRIDTSWTKTEEDILKDINRDLERHPDLVLNEEDKEAAKRKIMEVLRKQSEKQKRRVREAFKKTVSACESDGKPVVCTVALSHFPVTWLLKTPYEKIRDFLFTEGLSDVNVWLCGHAHKAQLYFSNDDAKSTLMLMTGVGRDELQTTKHRYSIYLLNLERNTIDVKVRSIGISSTDQFEADRELYGKFGAGVDYYPFPLIYNQAGAFHRLNAQKRSSGKNILLDTDTVSVFREVSLRMGVLYARLQAIVCRVVENLEDTMAKGKSKYKALTHQILAIENTGRMQLVTDEWRAMAEKVVSKNKVIEKMLAEMVSEIEEVFTQILPESGLGDKTSYVSSSSFKGIDWRVHFRRYVGAWNEEVSTETDEYVAVAPSDLKAPKNAPFEGPISLAYGAAEKMMVKSVAGVDNPIKTDWSDFITGVPDFPENVIEFRRPLPPKYRPLLTYGVSVRYRTHESCQCASRILCGLDFAMLNRCISYALSAFIQRVKCDLRSMISQKKTR